MKKIIITLTILSIFLAELSAAHLKDNLLFSAKLEGSQEVPAVSTTAVGIASFMLNKSRDTLSFNISVNGLSGSITSAHIHTGIAGVAGPVLINLGGFIAGNKITGILTGASVTSNLAAMLAEGLYVNVHTAANPGGEIRGQIKLETDWNFTADLNGANEVPAVSGAAFGLGSFNLSLHRGILRFNVVCQNLTGPITGVHLHFGAIGIAGPVAESLMAFVSGEVISGTITPSAATLDSLFAGKIYVNVHTAANPGGEIRAQLTNRKALNFDASLNGAQEIPAVTTNAKGVLVMYLNRTLDTLRYDAVASGLSGAITGAHFHNGVLNASGPVVHDLSAGIVGNRIKGFITGAALTQTSINTFLKGDVYINIHTAANPNGEIRGQVYRLAREGYTINLTGSQEIPAVSSAAYGSGIVSVSREQDNAHYMWVVGGLSSLATGAHFHKAVSGQSGGVVFDMSGTMAASTTKASAFGYWKSTDATPFLLSNSVQFRNDSIYLNVHNATFPNGELRGQVLRGQVVYQTTSIYETEFTRNTFLNVSPNPTPGVIRLDIEKLTGSGLFITVLDMTGKLVYQQSEQNVGKEFSTSIDFSNQPDGLYFVNVSDGKSMISKKVFKN